METRRDDIKDDYLYVYQLLFCGMVFDYICIDIFELKLFKCLVYKVQQQNNMNQYQQPHSPTYQHHQLFSKNNRLYQQLLQDDYLNDHVYQHNSHRAPHAAHIKFSNSPSNPIKIYKQPESAPQYLDFSPKLSKTNNLFKGFEPSVGKISNQATQSLSSNYCITQNENEQNSTVNLYSLSRNHIEPDLDFSSNNVTAKINEQKEEADSQNKTEKHDNTVLQASILNNNSINHEDSAELQSENIKKYRSLQYSHLAYNTPEEEQDEQKMPKILTDKYIKNDVSKKFSISHHSEQDVQSNFKTVLNEIHVVPYMINNEVKPYAFSVPIDNRQYQSNQNYTVATSIDAHDNKKAGKANSLNLNKSNYSSHQQQIQVSAPMRPLYFSNHTHLNDNQNRVSGHFIAHQPSHEAQKSRAYPRSQPKYTHPNDRNTRSNSIQCKNKPNILIRDQSHENQVQKNPQVRQHLQQSHVTKIFKNHNIPSIPPGPLETSVIYESQGINLCCNLTRQSEQVNKINFMTRPREQAKLKNENNSPFFCSSIDMTKVSTLQNGKGIYKINPIQMIRQMSQVESHKGIKLVGFPSRKEKA